MVQVQVQIRPMHEKRKQNLPDNFSRERIRKGKNKRKHLSRPKSLDIKEGKST